MIPIFQIAFQVCIYNLLALLQVTHEFCYHSNFVKIITYILEHILIIHSDLFNPNCEDLHAIYRCCLGGRSFGIIGKKRKRRSIFQPQKMTNAMQYQTQVWLAKHMVDLNELKYESRLEFGTAESPSLSAIWAETRKILIDGSPQRSSTSAPVKIPVNPRDLCIRKNSRFICP